MALATLMLATSLAQGWSQWFVVGLGFGVILMIIAGIITFFQSKHPEEQHSPQPSAEPSNESDN